MNIIIVGCGKVGSALAEQLCRENHNITIVDTDREALDSLVSSLDVQPVYGNGTTYRVLKEAGVDQADLLIAVTGYDERNMLSCLVARKASKKCEVIARVRDPEYNEDSDFLKGELGLSMVINPEMAAAQNIFRLLRMPSALDVDTFENSRVNMLRFRVGNDSPLHGHNMVEVAAMAKGNMLVCIQERGKEAVIPSGSTTLFSGDIISVMIPFDQAASVMKKLKLNQRPATNCIIGGGSATAQYLTGMLLASGVQVKIIDRDRQKCEELANHFPSAQIVCGDCTNKQLLSEEGLEDTDAFVCLTDQDEVNIMLSLYATSISDAKVVAKISRINFEEVVDKLNMGSVIYPKNITAENIVRYVRAMGNAKGNNVETLYRMADGKVEAMEFVVQEGSPVIGIPLMDLRLKRGLLVCSILRNGINIIPTGHDTLEAGDIIVIITTVLGIRDLSDVLTAR